MSNQTTHSIINNCINSLSGILFFLIILLSCFVTIKNAKNPFKGEIVDITNSWTDEYDQYVSLNSFQKKSTESKNIYLTLEHNNDPRKIIIFCTRNMYSDIYINNQLISKDQPVSNPILGTSPGVRWHYANIPVANHPINICIKNTPVYDNSFGVIINAYMGNANDVYANIFFKLVPSFILSLFFILTSFVLLTIYRVFKKKYHTGKEFSYLGAGTFFAGIWSLCETYIVQLYFGNSELIHFISYLALLALPLVFALILLTSNCKGIWKFIAQMYAFITCMNCLITCFLHLTGIAEFHYTLKVTHILLIVFIPLAALMLKGYQPNKAKKKTDFVQDMELLLIIACLLLSLYNYHFGKTNRYTTYFRLCISLFLLSLILYHFNTMVTLIKNGTKADMLHTLATTDSLTGLLNRTALNEQKKHYTDSKSGYIKVGLILLDLNFLKQINDNYGHEKGDQLLQFAAEGISNAFAQYGDCYRIGGDEFLVVITKGIQNWSYTNGIHVLDGYCKNHNHNAQPWEYLEIAHGYVYNENLTFDEAMVLADQKMYQNKKELKEKKKNQ